jgi:hypothetical protein
MINCRWSECGYGDVLRPLEHDISADLRDSKCRGSSSQLKDIAETIVRTDKARNTRTFVKALSFSRRSATPYHHSTLSPPAPVHCLIASTSFLQGDIAIKRKQNLLVRLSKSPAAARPALASPPPKTPKSTTFPLPPPAPTRLPRSPLRFPPRFRLSDPPNSTTARDEMEMNRGRFLTSLNTSPWTMPLSPAPPTRSLGGNSEGHNPHQRTI